MSAVEKFPILLSEAEEESSAVPPCFSSEGINVCFEHTTISRENVHSANPSEIRSISTLDTTISTSSPSQSVTQMPPKYCFSYIKSWRFLRSTSKS